MPKIGRWENSRLYEIQSRAIIEDEFRRSVVALVKFQSWDQSACDQLRK
jgi:hypothetical protein